VSELKRELEIEEMKLIDDDYAIEYLDLPSPIDQQELNQIQKLKKIKDHYFDLEHLLSLKKSTVSKIENYNAIIDQEIPSKLNLNLLFVDEDDQVEQLINDETSLL
jgi:hypothetical protein